MAVGAARPSCHPGIRSKVEWGSSCESGGTGRRAGFRIQWPEGRGGSNPPSRTHSDTEAASWARASIPDIHPVLEKHDRLGG